MKFIRRQLLQITGAAVAALSVNASSSGAEPSLVGNWKLVSLVSEELATGKKTALLGGFTAMVCTLVISGIMIAAAVAQTAAPALSNFALYSFPIAVAAGDYDLINQVLDLPPGSGVPNHSHGGPVVVTVIAGEVTLIEGGGERVVKSGESWTESVGYVHAVTNKGASTARVVASYLIPKGVARTTPVK